MAVVIAGYVAAFAAVWWLYSRRRGLPEDPPDGTASRLPGPDGDPGTPPSQAGAPPVSSYIYRLPRRYRYRPRGGSGNAGPILGAVVLAGLLASGAAHHGAARGIHPAGAAIARGPAPAGGTLSCTGLERLWESAGGSPRAAFLAAEIAMAESSGRQYASLYNTNGTTDRGYWQINSVHGSLSTFDAHANARSAVIISGNGTNWSPWVTYNIGAYVGKC